MTAAAAAAGREWSTLETAKNVSNSRMRGMEEGWRREAVGGGEESQKELYK